MERTIANYVEHLRKLPLETFEKLEGKYLSTFGFDGVVSYGELVAEMDRTACGESPGHCDGKIQWEKKRKGISGVHEVARVFEEAVSRGIKPAGVASLRTDGKPLEKRLKTGDIKDRVYVGPYYAMFTKEPCLKEFFDPSNKSPFALPPELKVYVNPERDLDAAEDEE